MNYCESFCRTIQRLCNSGAAPLLPAEYQQVEYLQSNGTQYINIGPVGNHQYYNIDFEWVAPVNNSLWSRFGLNGLVGITDYSSAGINDVKVWLKTGYLISGACGNTQIGQTAISTGVRYRLFFSNTKFELNGQDLTLNTGSQFAGTPNAYIFGIHDRTANTSNNASAVKINRVATNSIKLVPCYRKSDNKPGMYDLVTKTFFTNAGTGEFSVGNNV